MASLEVAEVVSTNVRRLRTEFGWSQADLARRIREQGLRRWSPGVIGLIETGGQRADRLLDLTALSLAFGRPITELLEPAQEGDTIIVAGPAPFGVAQLQFLLHGILPADEEAGVYPEGEDPYVLARIARKLDLELEQFRLAVRAIFGRSSFFEIRDELAGIDVVMGTAEEIRARRAAATKGLLAKMRQMIDQNGIEGLTELALQDLREMATFAEAAEGDGE